MLLAVCRLKPANQVRALWRVAKPHSQKPTGPTEQRHQHQDPTICPNIRVGKRVVGKSRTSYDPTRSPNLPEDPPGMNRGHSPKRPNPYQPQARSARRVHSTRGESRQPTMPSQVACAQPRQIVHPCPQCPDPQRRLGRPGTHVETQRFKKVQCMDPMSCAGKQTTKSSGYSITHASSTQEKKGLEGICTQSGGHHKKSGVLLTMLHASSENVTDSASQEKASTLACASVRIKDGKAPCTPNRAHHLGAHVDLVVFT